MRIESINVSEKKGVIKHPVDSAAITERGIVGDAHSGSWHRQISMLSTGSIEKFSERTGRSIFPGEFAENLTVSGMNLTETRLLDRFRSGDLLLELTQIGKKCHGDGCAVFSETGNCIMSKEGIFCRVINPAAIKTGDILEHIPFYFSFKIITLSDRAYSGEYEDSSGPEIEKIIKDTINPEKWRISVQRTVIPDEPERLEAELNEAVKAGCSVVMTTGGTGAGPRDITPETVKPMLHRELPGIMEYIRCKYGERFPNALLSRSVAGTIGETQVFTLPGSVKAAGEYCTEILRTVEHALFMLKGVDLHR